MSIVKKILIVLTVTTLVLQIPGCGQQRPSSGGTQQKDGAAKDTTSQPQDTASDTAK
ncbi:MAG TPA: hypothetical protein VHP36_09265 [Chitinispirillaceae bacterium]|nr:hypothetical protein [Chitinispirillaceae bacterium]